MLALLTRSAISPTRRFGGRPAENGRGARIDGVADKPAALGEDDAEAAAATRRWARARELQRRARALGLRMS